MASYNEADHPRQRNGEYKGKGGGRVPKAAPAVGASETNKRKVLGDRWDNPVYRGGNEAVWETCDPDEIMKIIDRLEDEQGIPDRADRDSLAIAVTEQPLKQGEFTDMRAEAATWNDRVGDLDIPDDPDDPDYQSNKQSYDEQMGQYADSDGRLKGIPVYSVGSSRDGVCDAIERSAFNYGKHVSLVLSNRDTYAANADDLPDQLADHEELYDRPYVYKTLS
jgi:hypothetical protein